eukprot:scpid100556/ scgid30985/ 
MQRWKLCSQAMFQILSLSLSSGISVGLSHLHIAKTGSRCIHCYQLLRKSKLVPPAVSPLLADPSSFPSSNPSNGPGVAGNVVSIADDEAWPPPVAGDDTLIGSGVSGFFCFSSGRRCCRGVSSTSSCRRLSGC